MIRTLTNMGRKIDSSIVGTAADHIVGAGLFMGVGAGVGALNGTFNQVDNEWNSRGYEIFNQAVKGAGIGALAGGLAPGKFLRAKKYIKKDFGIDTAGRDMNNVMLEMNQGMRQPGGFIEKALKGQTMVASSGYMVGSMAATTIKSGMKSMMPGLTKEGRALKEAERARALSSVTKETRKEMTMGRGTTGNQVGMFGAMGLGAVGTGFAMSAMGAEEGHPYNAIQLARGGDASRKGLMAYQEAYQSSGIVASNPYQAGMRDTDDQYSSSAMRGSFMPISQGQQKRFSPGQFGDTGNLVLSLNQLRRA